MAVTPSFTMGIEEELLLVDAESRDLALEAPPAFFSACEAALGDQVAREYLRSQVEVGTRICTSAAQARADLVHLRRTVCGLAEAHGLRAVAASTHPFARWSAQQPTDKERYKLIAHDLAGVGRRLVICGMHVHVAIEDDALRIDLMNQVRYFLPHLLVLSTSSPFWQGHDTGLKCYRLAVYDELPRTGLPGRFDGWDEYQRTLAVLVDAGVIEDATKVWWDVRPSARFPTLEMRVTDVCTRLEDAIAIASLFRCLLRFLYRLRRNNQSWRTYPLFLLRENRWRAQRYGVAGTLFDFGKGTLEPFGGLVKELVALVAEDAAHFGCEAEIRHLETIVARGTSADRQVARFGELVAAGASRDEALRGVVDRLVAETAGTA